MKKLVVNSENPYEITITRDLKIDEYIKTKYGKSKILVITDENLAYIYSEYKNIPHYIINAGESSKDIEVYYKIIKFLSKNNFHRDSILLAFGGGVVGDITGFVASTYLRGIPFVQVPTSLLSMVDSSVGGKTGINTEYGKNLIGSFYNPREVLIDTRYLDTLPEEEFTNGLAEVIKTAMIGDRSLVEALMTDQLEDGIENIVEKSLKVKIDIVQKDMRESNLRRILNFGHTIGHGIEKLSDYKIKHGEGVAIGMAMISKAFHKKGLTPKDTLDILVALLEKYSLAKSFEVDKDSLFKAILIDKKTEENYINLVYLENIGMAKIYKAGLDELKDILQIAIDGN